MSRYRTISLGAAVLGAWLALPAVVLAQQDEPPGKTPTPPPAAGGQKGNPPAPGVGGTPAGNQLTPDQRLPEVAPGKTPTPPPASAGQKGNPPAPGAGGTTPDQEANPGEPARRPATERPRVIGPRLGGWLRLVPPRRTPVGTGTAQPATSPEPNLTSPGR